MWFLVKPLIVYYTKDLEHYQVMRLSKDRKNELYVDKENSTFTLLFMNSFLHNRVTEVVPLPSCTSNITLQCSFHISILYNNTHAKRFERNFHASKIIVANRFQKKKPIRFVLYLNVCTALNVAFKNTNCNRRLYS